MGSLLHALAEVFIFLMEIVLDLLCLVLLLVSLVGFWRWPFLSELREGGSSERKKFRVLAATNFGCVMLDIFILPFLCVTLCSWRCIQLIQLMSKRSQAYYSLERRGYIMLEFALLIFDIPFIIMLVFGHATFWRIPWLWRDLADEVSRSGITLCSDTTSSSKFRSIIALNALNGFIDIFLLPFALVVLLTAYRVRRTKLEWERKSELLEMKLVIIVQCLQVFADLPFALLTLLTVALLIRAKAVIEDIAESTGTDDWRWIAAYHFILSFRDWLCVPLVAPLLASVYRFYFCVTGIKNAVTRWNIATPMLSVQSVHLELPEATRGRGVIVRVKASKRVAAFALTKSSSVKLYIRNKTFWSGVGNIMGGAIASVGQTLLPLSIAPKYFDVSQLTVLPVSIAHADGVEGGSGECGEFMIDFNTATCKTIRKNANKLNGEYADIQLEYEGAVGVSAEETNGTLFAVKVQFKHFDEYVDAKAPLATVNIAATYLKAVTDGKRFCDVFWKYVLIELCFLIFDLVCLTFLILLHLVPHRIYRVYSTACQGTERKHARSKVEAAQAFREFLLTKKALFFRVASKADNAARLQLGGLTPSNERDESDVGHQFPMQKVSYYNYGLQSARREANQEASDVRAMLSALDSRREKLITAGCSEVVEALAALDSQTSEHAVHLRRLLKTHFNNESPFTDVFHCLGLFPEEIALQRREEKEAEERAAALEANRKRVFDRINLHRGDPDDSSSDLQLAIEESLRHAQPSESGAYTDVSNDHAVPPHREDSQVPVPIDHDAQSRQASLMVASYSEPFGAFGGLNTPASGFNHPSELVASWSAAFDRAMSTTDAAIRSYEAAFAKTPWTGGKDGWGGVRKVVVHEVGMFMYDCLAAFCLLIVVCTLYRIVPFVRSIPKLNNLRRACLLQVAEIGIDILYLYKVLLIVSFVKGAFSLPSDLLFYLMQKPSFDVARQIIDYHLRSVLEDLLYILSLVFAWDTVRFALATAVFGVFSPCVVLEGAFSRWDGKSGENRPDWNPCVALFLLLLSSVWVIGVPVFVGYYVAQHSVATAPGAVFFAIMGFVLYLGLAVSAAQRDEAVVAIRRNTIRCLTLSLRYGGLFLAQLLDAAQLLALVYQASRPDLYGATVGGGLEQASHYVFATFGGTWSSNGVPFGTYLAIVLAILYFIVSGAPVVCGDMLHWRKGSQIVQSPAWVALMTFLGQTCMLTVVRNITLLFVCDESTGRLSFSAPDAPATCWEGGLRSTTVFCAILLTYYVPTALMKNQKFNVAIMRSVDVVAPQLYYCLTRLPVATCCVLCTLRYEHRAFTLSTVLVTMIWCVAVSLVYPRWMQSPISSVKTIGWYKVIVYAAVGIAAALVLGQLQQDVATGPSYWSLYATIAVIVSAIVAVVVVGALLSRATRAYEDSIDDVKQTMARARKELASLGAIKAIPGEGDATGKVFARRLAQATRCSELAVLLLYLESQCYTVELSAIFLSTRQAWEKKTISIMDPNDKSNALDIDWYRMDFPRYLLCCECCRDVNSHNRSGEEDDDNPSVTEEDKLVALQEVCQSLLQAAHCR
jgi:hypothetical protein